MRIFSIRDAKAEAFNKPFFSTTRATAMREVALGLQQDENMAAVAIDYALYDLGEFDQTTGRITTSEQPHHLCDCAELVNPDQADQATPLELAKNG